MTPTDPQPLPRQVPALVRGLAILWALTERPMTATEITRALELPRTSVHELLKTLEGQRMVTQTNGRYAVGIRLFELGMAAGSGLDLAPASQDVTRDIAAEVDETVQVAVLDHTDVVYVAKAESSHAVKLVSRLGSRLPAHVTAVGKALLAFQPADWVEQNYPRDAKLTKLTSRSITDPVVLRSQLTEIAGGEVASEYCESNEDVRCVAAPVRDHSGQVVAGLSISVPVYRWDPGKASGLESAVVEGARRLSEALGYRDG